MRTILALAIAAAGFATAAPADNIYDRTLRDYCQAGAREACCPTASQSTRQISGRVCD